MYSCYVINLKIEQFTIHFKVYSEHVSTKSTAQKLLHSWLLNFSFKIKCSCICFTCCKNTSITLRSHLLLESLIPPKLLLNNRKRSEMHSKSYKQMKNKMFIVRVICEFQNIHVCSTCEKKTDLFSVIIHIIMTTPASGKFSLNFDHSGVREIFT